MGLETSVVEEVCKELGIAVPQKHLTQLASEDAVRVKQALSGGKRASKETRVDGTIVRRRKKAEDEKPAAPVSAAAASNVQVAGGVGSIATSPTTVRRKKVDLPAESEPGTEYAHASAPGFAAEVAPLPVVEPPRVEVKAKPEPTESRAVIVSRPSRRVEPTPPRGRAPEPRVEKVVEKTPSRPEPEVAVAQPPRVEERAPEPVVVPAVQPEPEVPVQTPAELAEAEARVAQAQQNTSQVKVVRRVDDAIMQNLLREAQRRAERQAAGPRRPGPGGPPGQGPAGQGYAPGGPASRRGPRPDMPQQGPPTSVGARPGVAPAPAPAGAPAGDRGRGRVAWDKDKDKRFDDGLRRGGKGKRPLGRGMPMPEAPVQRAAKRVIKIEDTVTVGELAAQLSVKASEIIKKLMLLGEMVTVNNVLDMDTVQLLAQEPEFNFDVENVAFDIENYIPKTDEGVGEALPRDPVVTVMGHVDHGKTSLLDYIRKARVAAGEAGGITQHIGAYKVPVMVNGKQRHVVFLDTPGHAAFTAMRARGAQVTDVVILVVAADDGVMPQTAEAINHAKAAGVPLVVAVNKCDKPEARPDKVRQQLTEYGVVAEEWGGDAQFIDVSAKTGLGIDTLLESVALQADVLELKAVANRPAKGVVIEAELSKGRGPVATILVQEGTLNRGDIVVAGKAMGRVRAMVDDRGRSLQSAGPATPVEVLGLDSVPQASERFFCVKDERDAKAIVDHIEEKERKGRLAEERKKVSLDDLFAQMQAGEVKTLNLVIKSDVQGSLEALRTAFSKLKHPELEVRIIHDAVGAISEHDVYLASASNAIIIGFNVRPEKNAKTLAEQYKVDIKLYSVIYNAVDDVKSAMEGMLKPNIEEKFVGRAAVRETFSIPKFGTIAGCAVLQGKLIRGHKARLIRDGRVISDTKIDTLRRFKEQVTEVDRGHECGAHLENYNDLKIGDEIECYELIEIAQKLELQP
jgi:translation initiation factor IF-2